MALILNIETTSGVCSVCLSENGKILSLQESSEPNSHSARLTVLIDELFKTLKYSIEDIDAVAVSRGPGSYTGLRIGISVAKGICYALNKPLIAVDTLQSLAVNILENSDFMGARQTAETDDILICPLVDARRMEVYTALYDVCFNPVTDISAMILDPGSFADLLETKKILFGGTGAEKFKKIMVNPNADFIDIDFSSKYMVRFSESYYDNKKFEDTSSFEPFYLKEFIAGIPKRLTRVMGKDRQDL